MITRILYRLGLLARLLSSIVTDTWLTLRDSVLDALLGPTRSGSRREIREWSRSVRQMDLLENSEMPKVSTVRSDKLKFGQGEVANHLAQMNRQAKEHKP